METLLQSRNRFVQWYLVLKGRSLACSTSNNMSGSSRADMKQKKQFVFSSCPQVWSGAPSWHGQRLLCSSSAPEGKADPSSNTPYHVEINPGRCSWPCDLCEGFPFRIEASRLCTCFCFPSEEKWHLLQIYLTAQAHLELAARVAFVPGIFLSVAGIVNDEKKGERERPASWETEAAAFQTRMIWFGSVL